MPGDAYVCHLGFLAGTIRVERQGDLVEGKLDISRKGTRMSLLADPWQSLRPQSLTSRAGDRCSSTRRSLWISPWLPSLLFCGWGLFRPCQLSSRTRILAVPGRDPWDPSQAGSIHVQPVKRTIRLPFSSLIWSSLRGPGAMSVV